MYVLAYGNVDAIINAAAAGDVITVRMPTVAVDLINAKPDVNKSCPMDMLINS